MKLHTAIESYISHRRSLGAVFCTDARVLRSFARAAQDVGVRSITPQLCRTFCRGNGPPTRHWERKHTTLRGFFDFLVVRGHLDVSPLQGPSPKVSHDFVPRILCLEELQCLLEATAVLQLQRSTLAPQTFRTLVLLLYAAGLRAGEALRLRCCDVDLGDGVLTIWNSKFFKSRLVPIGHDLIQALKSYDILRKTLPMPLGLRSAFFALPHGGPISLAKLERVFAQLRNHAKIAKSPQTDQLPRLHDLRHTFAVHRLVTWYQEGADVQACLPLLAVYLGHANLSGTQTYLSMTPQLLAEASKRFDNYVQAAKERECHG